MRRSTTSGSEGLQPVATGGAADKAWRQHCGRAHAAFGRMANRIASAHQGGRRTHPLVRDFLRNPEVRLSAALRALGGCPNPEVAFAVRDQTNPWSENFPEIEWYSRPKSSGGTRPICILPPALKAVHYMLAAVVGALMNEQTNIFGTPGTGRDDWARQFKALQNKGFRFLAATDIRSCFQSVNPDALYELPLPQEVIHKTLDARSMNFVRSNGGPYGGYPEASRASSWYRDYSHDSYNPSGPRGLMQGSPASSIILARLLDGLPQSEEARVLLCFDNLVIAARNAAGSRAMAATLADHFHRCSAGPFELCDTFFADDRPLDSLGYHFDPNREDIGIAESTLSKLERRLSPADETACIEGNLFPVRVWRTIRDFANGFPAVANMDQELGHYVATTRDAALSGGDPLAVFLHDNLLAPRGTTTSQLIKALLRK